jgi:DNA polymerase-3 subunit delta'
MLFDDMPDDEDILFDEAEDASDLVDAPVESDEVPTPRLTAKLLGHQDIEKQLLFMLDNHRFPHGLIFSGRAGIGKSVMAYRLARYLYAKAGKEEEGPSLFGDPTPAEPATSLYIPPTDPVFARVASGGNADLLMIERPFDEKTGRFKGSVPVDEIRKIAPFMRKTASTEGGWRIVIVDDADTMTRSSQNSLLKILEEPPEKSLLVLIAHRAGALLPTIYSRCVHIPFAPLSDDVIKGELAGRCGAEQIPLITHMAEGSLGAAYEYAEPHHADLIAQTIHLFAQGQKFSWNDIQTFADFFGNKGNDDAQRIFRETMLWIGGSLVRGRPIQGFDNFAMLPMARRLKIYDDLRAHFDRCMLGNLDKRFLIIGAFMAFE